LNTKRRRILTAFALLVLVPTAYLAILLAFGRASEPSILKRIQVGMTWQEVTAILGSPLGATGGTANSMNWCWEFCDGIVIVTMTSEGEWHVIAKQGEWYEPTSLFVRRGLSRIGF
jgi:hypothetical protein